MAKTAPPYTIKGDWHDEEYGQVYTAKAVTPAGRILAIVHAEVPLMVGIDLVQAFGQEGRDEIVKAADDNARRIADGMIARGKNKALDRTR